MTTSHFDKKKSHWLYQNKPFGILELETDPRFAKIDGFIYMITCLDNNKFYIGKKSLYSIRKVKATHKDIENTKYLRKNSHGEKMITKMKMSNWYNYTSSCEQLKLDIKKLGKQKFKFEILHFCAGKLQLSYYELKYLMDFACIEVDNCYNDAINERMTRISIQ